MRATWVCVQVATYLLRNGYSEQPDVPPDRVDTRTCTCGIPGGTQGEALRGWHDRAASKDPVWG